MPRTNDISIAWRIYETIDGREVLCADMPHPYPHPNDLVPALLNLRSQGRNVQVHGRPFTRAMAVTALYRGATAEQIRRVTNWPAEVMGLVIQAAELRKRVGI